MLSSQAVSWLLFKARYCPTKREISPGYTDGGCGSNENDNTNGDDEDDNDDDKVMK